MSKNTYFNINIRKNSRGLPLNYYDFVASYDLEGDPAQVSCIHRIELSQRFNDLLLYLQEFVAEEKDVVELGEFLWHFLFPSEIGEAFQQLVSRYKNEERIVLRLNIEPPELSILPWEYCYYPDKRSFLALRVRFVRHTDKSNKLDLPTITGPLKILMVMASPKNMPPLDLEAEEISLRKILKRKMAKNQVRLDVLKNASGDTLHKKILEIRPHIIHYLGHGELNSGKACLALESSTGLVEYFSGEKLANLLYNRNIRLVVLNACKTARSNDKDAFVGLPPNLLLADIPAVLAMQFNVPDSVAIQYAEKLYDFLVLYLPIDQAISEMRLNTYNQSSDISFMAWGIAILFLQTLTGNIFNPLQQELEKIKTYNDQGKYDEVLNHQPHDINSYRSKADFQVEYAKANIGSKKLDVAYQNLEKAIRLLQTREQDSKQQPLPDVEITDYQNILEEDRLLSAYAYKYLGIIHAQKGQIDQALDYWKLAHTLAYLQDDLLQAQAWLNIGGAYLSQRRLSKAQNFLERGRDTAKQFDATREIIRGGNNLAIVYLQKGMLGEGLEQATYAIEQAISLGIREHLPDLYDTKASIYRLAMCFEEARRYYELARTEEELSRPRGLPNMQITLNLAFLYNDWYRYESASVSQMARQLFEDVLEPNSKAQSWEILQAHLGMLELKTLQYKWTEAYEYYQREILPLTDEDGNKIKNDPEFVSFLRMRGDVLYGIGQSEIAITLWLSALDILQNHHETAGYNVEERFLLSNLVNHYQKVDNQDEVDKYQAQLEAFDQKLSLTD